MLKAFLLTLLAGKLLEHATIKMIIRTTISYLGFSQSLGRYILQPSLSAFRYNLQPLKKSELDLLFELTVPGSSSMRYLMSAPFYLSHG